MNIWKHAMVGVALCVASTQVNAQSALQAEMQRLEESRNRSIRQGDFETLNRIYADDFSGINGAGRIVTRDELFSIFRRAGGNFGKVTSTVISARQDAGHAFVVGRLEIEPAAGGIPSRSMYLHVFRRSGDEWKMVTGSATPEQAPRSN